MQIAWSANALAVQSIRLGKTGTRMEKQIVAKAEISRTRNLCPEVVPTRTVIRFNQFAGTAHINALLAERLRSSPHKE